MTDDFVGFVLFNSLPVIDPTAVEKEITALEPENPAQISESGGTLTLTLGSLVAQLSISPHPMPEEAAVSSLGMANLPEDEREMLANHSACIRITCNPNTIASGADGMIALLKAGAALCQSGGLALCVPACGNCHTAAVLAHYRELNHGGPRAWGVDESESELVTYERYTLWGSLRGQAEPAELLVGFVPAQLEGGTWFFSAGHSLFGMPELAYCDGTIEDYRSVREFFRVLFRSYYKRPKEMAYGQSVQLSSSVTLDLERLPPQFREFEATTGTLLVRMNESFFPEKDWD